MWDWCWQFSQMQETYSPSEQKGFAALQNWAKTNSPIWRHFHNSIVNRLKWAFPNPIWCKTNPQNQTTSFTAQEQSILCTTTWSQTLYYGWGHLSIPQKTDLKQTPWRRTQSSCSYIMSPPLSEFSLGKSANFGHRKMGTFAKIGHFRVQKMALWVPNENFETTFIKCNIPQKMMELVLSVYHLCMGFKPILTKFHILVPSGALFPEHWPPTKIYGSIPLKLSPETMDNCSLNVPTDTTVRSMFCLQVDMQ